MACCQRSACRAAASTPALPVLLPCLLLVSLLSFRALGCPFHVQNDAPGANPGPNLLPSSSPGSSGTALGAEEYRQALLKLDLAAVKADVASLLHSSQPSWPSDWGFYGGLFIRHAWHCSGSYRNWDGRGGCDGAQIRFYPEIDWPDNANLDKARQVLQPIKDKYGASLSWGDLIILAGTTAIEQGGGETLGICLVRVDDADGTDSLELGPTQEQQEVAPCGTQGMCEKPLGPTTMGLIYVDPAGPLGVPDPHGSATQIRDSFSRMSMNDTETVALIGGGHAFGKAHGACPAGKGLCGTGPQQGIGPNTYTSGFEGAWTTTPTIFSNAYFTNLLSFNWVVHNGTGGYPQWMPTPLQPEATGDSNSSCSSVPDIFMLTSDVALLNDPSYLQLVTHYSSNITALKHDFKYAWYKLTTRDVGPISRCVNVSGALPPAQPWQCPLPQPKSCQPLNVTVIAEEINTVMKTNNPVLLPDVDEMGKPTYAALFVALAWQSASTYRRTDHQGGTNGARIRCSPMAEWPENKGMDLVLSILDPLMGLYPGLSYADLIVLAGTLALGQGNLSLPFTFGRSDALEACVVDRHLMPRHYQAYNVLIKDDAKVKGLSLPQYVALFGMPRSPSQQLRLNYSGSWATEVQPLSNAFFVALLSEKWVEWTSAQGTPEYKSPTKDIYITPVDYALTQDPELLSIAQQFAANSSSFLEAFSTGWVKMMNAEVPFNPSAFLEGGDHSQNWCLSN